MHPKKHIPLIPLILKSKGVSYAVISPGSRNAPLIEAFYQVFGGNCISIVDERSAAYFALGLAGFLKRPIVIITTSGTAVLNLAPALAEAFYLGVPLIAITADRPPEWIDQEDNQTIRQTNVFLNIKASYNLPVQMDTEEDYWFAERIINEAGNICIFEKPGPVHINVPLREPLYVELPKVENFRVIKNFKNPVFDLPQPLRKTYLEAEKILIVAGQLPKYNNLNSVIEQILTDSRIIIFSQAISNLPEISGIINGDITLMANQEIPKNYNPDLIIYFGGQVVSKRVKQFLRSQECVQWLVNPEGKTTDTFQILDSIIQTNAIKFLESLSKFKVKETHQNYQQIWTDKYQLAYQKSVDLAQKAEYSDLAVFYSLCNKFRANDIVFAGNSSIIRYLQLFSIQAKDVYANRGTSGIDGCLSTAAGIAYSTEKTVYAILGDLSFLYDSNGLWNNNLPKNLKIILINNSGGGIFSLIDGPQSFTSFEQFFNTAHDVDIAKLCAAYHTNYYFCSTIHELESTFPVLSQDTGTSLLEIKTPEKASPRIFSNFIKQLKS